MTGLLHEKEFSRKAFVKGGGALVVGFSLAGFGAKAAKAAESDPVSACRFSSIPSNLRWR